MFYRLLKIKNFKLKTTVSVLLFLISIFLPDQNVSAATLSKTLQRPSNNLGLVGYWTFDGTNMSPNVRDSSGQGNHGNLVGQTSTTTTPGKIGQALSFDGAGDYINIPAYTQLNNTSEMTVCSWVYLNTLGGTLDSDDSGVFSKSVISSSNELILLWYNVNTSGTNGAHTYSFNVGSASTLSNRVNGATSAKVNVWQHVCGVMTGSSRSIYIDGSLDVSVGGAALSSYTGGSSDVEIGRWSAVGDLDMDGKIDDTRIYNRALSATEIQSLYNLSAGTKTSRSIVARDSLSNSLIGYWTFDGTNMSPNVRDSSGQGNHGNLVGQTSTTTTPGKIGQALSFDGVDDYVTIPVISGLDAATKATISAWVYRDSASQRVVFGQYKLSPHRFSVGWWDDGKVYFTAENGSTSYPSFLNTETGWHFVTLVFDGSATGLARITAYWDGEVRTLSSGGASPASSLPTGSNQGLFRIGMDSDGGTNDRFGSGKVDDVRVYNRTLAASEVSRLYSLGVASKTSKSTVGGNQLSSGLVGYWTFDGTNMSPNVRDSSGQGNHGNLVGQTSTTTTPGKIGQALSFDGVDDYIQTTSNDLKTANNFTITTWFKAKTTKTGQHLICQGEVAGNGWGPQEEMHISIGDFITGSVIVDKLTFFLGNQSTLSTSDVIDINIPFTDLGWNFFSVTVSNLDTSPSADMFLNGVFVGSDIGTTALTGRTTWNYLMRIGRCGAATRNFNGSIDDTRIYNRVLSAEEISRLYNMGR